MASMGVMGESWLCFFSKNGIITRKVAEETLPSTSRSRRNAEMLKRITYLTVNTYNKFVSNQFVTGAGLAQCLTTGWTTGRSGFDPRQRQRIFPLAPVSTPALRPTQPPVQWVPGGHFPGGKARQGRDANHSPQSSAEVVNE
jgi:hypothetical protein